jgi:hypothetical protein
MADFWWLFFSATSRFIKPPFIPVVDLYRPLWEEDDDPEDVAELASPADNPAFEGCENTQINLKDGTPAYKIGHRDGVVLGVYYDLPVYRQSGHHRMRKLRYFLEEHGRNDPFHHLVDNGSAMLYRSESEKQFAIYLYLTDIFIVHAPEVKLRRGAPMRDNNA